MSKFGRLFHRIWDSAFHRSLSQSRGLSPLGHVELLEERLNPVSDFFVVPGTTGAVRVDFSYAFRDSHFQNEIGVYAISDAAGRVNGILPGRAGYAQAALSNATTLFAATDRPGAAASRVFQAGQRLAFYIVPNAARSTIQAINPTNSPFVGTYAFFSMDGATPDGVDHFQGMTIGDGNRQFMVEDQRGGGDRDFNDVIFWVGVSGQRAVRVPGNSTQSVPVNLKFLSADSGFRNEIGIFQVDNAQGRIGTTDVFDPGYAQLALSRAKIAFNQSAIAGQNTSFNLPGGSFFGLYLVSDGNTGEFLARNPGNAAGGPRAYFIFPGANPDGFDHLRWLNGSDFVFEDGDGGGDRDFNDFVGRITFGRPTAGDTTPPATPTIGIDPDGSTTTTNATVTLSGVTDPNTTVRLVQGNRTATANAQGKYTFANVALTVGSNNFTVNATDVAGNTSTATQTITRNAGNAAPTVKTAIGNVALTGTNNRVIDLAANFDDVDMTNSRIRFNTPSGAVNVELFDRQAPQTVANFFNYITSGRYNNSIFHRGANLNGSLTNPADFVLQGGGFNFQTGTPASIGTITTDPTIQNEPDSVNRSNLKGTIAMAKLGGNPNSASNQFFFNLGNNASTLDTQNGGFTVFGKLVATADQTVVDTLAAIPRQNQGTAANLPGNQQGIFTEIPLQNYTGTQFPNDTTAANYALVNTVEVVSRPEELTYTILTNTTPAVATAAIVNNRLTVTAVSAGTTNITVRATDKAGATVDNTFTVTVT